MTRANDKKVYVTGFYDVPLDQLEEVKCGLLENVELTRREDGNEKYEYWFDEEVEGRIYLSEVFRNQAALDAHIARVKESPWATISKDVKKTFKVRIEDS